MKRKPLISVIVPVYNGEKFLREAIQSAVDQSYSNVEIIIIDDGSTDSSGQIAQSFEGLRYVYQDNHGLTASRNAGLRIAEGEWITFLDADDLWHRDKLRDQIEYHLAHPEIGLSFTLEKFFFEKRNEIPNWARKRVFQSEHIAYCAGSSMIHRDVFAKIGMFSPEDPAADMTEWLFRAKDQGVKYGEIHSLLLYRRIHENNLSHNVSDQKHALLETVHASILRQRKRKG